METMKNQTTTNGNCQLDGDPELHLPPEPEELGTVHYTEAELEEIRQMNDGIPF